MAADVSSLIRVIRGVDASDSGSGGKPGSPITRDLLGGCGPRDSEELDLDLQVPCGWEKRLDLKSGKVYLQRCSSLSCSSAASEFKSQAGESSEIHGLHSPPPSKRTLDLFEDVSLDLKLVPSSSPSPTSPIYQSVCTLDKVKSALERAERAGPRKRSISLSNSSSPLSNASSSARDGDHDPLRRPSASFAAGCPSCLLYVLISKINPNCPRCGSVVPLPLPPEAKKPRLDLNMSI